MRFATEVNGDRGKRTREKMKNPWLALGLMGAAGLLKKNALRFTQTQVAIAYLKGIDVLRDVLFYQVGLIFCVIFFTFGFVLMQVAVIFAFPVTEAARLKIFFAAGLLDLTIALGVLLFLTSSKLWIRQAAKHNTYLKELMEENKRKVF